MFFASLYSGWQWATGNSPSVFDRSITEDPREAPTWMPRVSPITASRQLTYPIGSGHRSSWWGGGHCVQDRIQQRLGLKFFTWAQLLFFLPLIWLACPLPMRTALQWVVVEVFSCEMEQHFRTLLRQQQASIAFLQTRDKFVTGHLETYNTLFSCGDFCSFGSKFAKCLPIMAIVILFILDISTLGMDIRKQEPS